MSTLFLFAHQDDEIGVMSAIRRAAATDGAVCVYLTNGAWAGVESAVRDAESRKTLRALGVKSDCIHPIGTRLNIPDGKLVEHLDCVLAAVTEIITGVAETAHITRIVTHAWEGGHQDHDAGHLLGVALARRFAVLEASRQYALYRRDTTNNATVFAAPLDANGPVEATAVPLAVRLKNLRLLTAYRSQFRVIARLLPLILRDYFVTGTERLQPLSVARVHEAPNDPPMLYEKWHLSSYGQFTRFAQPFIARHLALDDPSAGQTGGGS